MSKGPGRPKGGKKYGGRKKGVPNKTTAETRAQLQAIIDALLPDALEMIRSIKDPSKRFDAIAKIFPYIMPKMQELKLDTDDILNEITITIKRNDES